jgi:hypothetical protein
MTPEELRQKDLEDRFMALESIHMAFYAIHPDTPNYTGWLEDLKVQADHADAEAKMVALEAKDVELAPILEADRIEVKRKREYPSIEELVVAMWENNPAVKAELESKRQSVKTKYPKG